MPAFRKPVAPNQDLLIVSDEKTLFEKIADRAIPAEFVHEDELCFAIRDVSPVAPTHILIIPRKPITGINVMDDEDASLVGHLFVTAKHIAEQEGLGSGYRLVFNVGSDANQTVPHLHLHLMGGRTFGWPPG
ncbi:histidine triad nucleotide-binding protein [soil metagenome]